MMGRGLAVVLALMVALAAGLPLPPRLEVRFSPRGGCAALAVREITEARASIRLLGYGFTSGPVADALIAAKGRGLDVALVLDRSNLTDRHGQAARCAAAGIPVRYDRRHAIAHNKVLIIDDACILTGSFNWTDAAERSNAENLLLVRDEPLAAIYAAEWARHRDHSEPRL